MFSDSKNQLQQEVEERMENMALLTDADKEINRKIDLKFESQDSEIKIITSLIEGMTSTIENLKNTDNVLANSLNDNALRFHVETSTGGHWPDNTLITYTAKLADTHNAMNTETGIFTVPISGTYGFVFYAEFQCDGVGAPANLYVDNNGLRSKIIFFCQSNHSTEYSSSSSVYFALCLKQGDTVGIYLGTDALVRLDPHPAKFTGFLLEKN